MDKLIITVVPAGKGRFPEAPDMDGVREQAEACIDAYNAGASVAHIHGAMTAGQGSREPDLDHWTEMAGLIRAKTDMIVQFGRAVMRPRVRRKLLTLRPDMGSFLLGAHDILTQNGELQATFTYAEQRESARYHQELGVLPELEVWHAGSIANMRKLIDEGLLKPPFYSTLFFAFPGGHWSPPTPQELMHRLSMLPESTIWGMSCRGPRQIAMHALAVAEGGHVRTGWEDNAELQPGQPARTNADLVERIVRIARELGREVASPAEARQMLGLPR